MKKSLPMSALITGLLAAPVMGIAPPALGKETQQAPIVRAQTFPAAMPGEVAEQIRRIARGEKPDAHGMQGLQRRIALQMQQRLAELRASTEGDVKSRRG